MTFFGRPRARLTGSITMGACFWGHVDVDVEAIEVRDEQVDENLRDCLTGADRVAVFVMKFTWSWRAMRCGGVIRLTETFLTSWNVDLKESCGRFIHSSLILETNRLKDKPFKCFWSQWTYMFEGHQVTRYSSSPSIDRLFPITLPLNETSTSLPRITDSAFSNRYWRTSIMPTSKKSKRRAVKNWKRGRISTTLCKESIEQTLK